MSANPKPRRVSSGASVPAGATDGSSVDRLEAALRDKILAGVYPPGSRLILSRLATEHEVSFIPVREALQRLEAERLVQIERNRGARVAEISITDMRDIYETRVVLELHAIRMAMANRDDALLETAAEALDRMELGFAADDERAAFGAHQDFHFSLYEPARSAWTMHLIRQLWASAERYVRLAAAVRPAPALFVAEHREIYEAVRTGDVEAAVNSLTANLRTTERLLTANYEGVPHRLGR